METKEKNFTGFKMNGFLMIAIHLLLLAACVYGFTTGSLPIVLCSAAVVTIVCILFAGYVQLEPNESKVLIFFGNYKGTFRDTGLFWVNPFLSQKKLSMRARNLDVDPIKVNDKIGNPILIGLVLVWKVRDTYKAMFEIDAQTMAGSVGTVGITVGQRMNAFESFVKVQSDAALRQVAGEYAYDNNGEENSELTLRAGSEQINDQMERKLNERLFMAGIEVVEARINYLAYAPEIAAVMLRRQQASAIIAAREKIVEGAVSMVKMALHQLADEDVVELDEDKKAAMVSNLLVVLCADEAAQPVVNTGTLHQ
ncbi:MAG: SPFH domain-containing protein [Mediterranea sp.]|jgi:regulator of protease activity HflC (stomatin/prohibitin superfamily)|nr:SPFH domain-containing protein [Mediterranea sp.]